MKKVKVTVFNLQRAKNLPPSSVALSALHQTFEELMIVLKKPVLNLKGKGLSRREREIGAVGKFKLSLEERAFMTFSFFATILPSPF